jgi:hypothetical protein
MPSSPTSVSGSIASSPTCAIASRAFWRSVRRSIQPKLKAPARGRRFRNRFSATDSVGSRFSSCITMRTPSASASVRLAGAYGASASRIVPALGSTSPPMIFDSVLLPAPFSPVNANTSPARNDSDTSASTGSA